MQCGPLPTGSADDRLQRLFQSHRAASHHRVHSAGRRERLRPPGVWSAQSCPPAVRPPDMLHLSACIPLLYCLQICFKQQDRLLSSQRCCPELLAKPSWAVRMPVAIAWHSEAGMRLGCACSMYGMTVAKQAQIGLMAWDLWLRAWG